MALYPNEQIPCIECNLDIKKLLRVAAKRRKPKLVIGSSGKLKNQASGYIAAAGDITDGWKHVVQTCYEAAVFDGQLKNVLHL